MSHSTAPDEYTPGTGPPTCRIRQLGRRTNLGSYLGSHLVAYLDGDAQRGPNEADGAESGDRVEADQSDKESGGRER